MCSTYFNDVCTQAERKYRIRGKESVDPIRVIDNIVNHFNNSGMTMSYLELLKQTPEVSHSPKLNGKKLSDLCEGKDGNELFFETKSPKPHKGQCLEVCDRLFHINSLKMLIHQKYKLIVKWPTTLMEMIN
jgi:hypothetical protein